jgi:oligopeptidase B
MHGCRYEDDGKQLSKWNTFTDFIACAEHLVEEGWTSKGRICAQGASAGGLLMGVIMNKRPDIWGAILSQVGFVDVMVTMSDESIPLTVTEYDEWGNPHTEEHHSYMASYSPMENVRPQAYPKTLLTAGLHDRYVRLLSLLHIFAHRYACVWCCSRVAYWEPAKFAQRLRDVNTGSNDILLKTELDGGHFSFMDRYAYLRDKAFDFAWAMDALGVSVCPSSQK